jgi:mRNA interferase HigB
MLVKILADRIVFNIKGNDYRLVVATDFDKGIVWIKWIGIHKDYDKNRCERCTAWQVR